MHTKIDVGLPDIDDDPDRPCALPDGEAEPAAAGRVRPRGGWALDHLAVLLVRLWRATPARYIDLSLQYVPRPFLPTSISFAYLLIFYFILKV